MSPFSPDRFLDAFNARPEIRWFGFRGAQEQGLARLTLVDVHDGKRGAGDGSGINGGVLSAAFDAVSVLAVQFHGDGRPVATVQLAVNFMRPVADPAGAVFGARVTHAGRSTAFVDAWLEIGGSIHASANAILRIQRPAAKE